TLYGYDDASRVSDPADDTKTFCWNISRTWDDMGNLAVYRYVHEDDAGIDLAAAHEANRTPLTRRVQTYLQTIQYGNLQPYMPDWSAPTENALPADWAFSVAFDYGDHSSTPPRLERDRAWPVRPDPSPTYRAG